MRITVHYHPTIPWQARHIDDFVTGLETLGHTVTKTTKQDRINLEPVVLFGTTCFRRIEEQPGQWLLVDRASYGDPEMVQLGWNGHGGRGDHLTVQARERHCSSDMVFRSRWRDHARRFGLEIKPKKMRGSRVILCGQESVFSPDYANLQQWYDLMIPACTHFKPHPAVPVIPVRLPVVDDFTDCKKAVVLNSSVAIQCLLDGVPVHVADAGSLAHNVDFDDRESFFEWLAWTQWTWDEIRLGYPIAHLFNSVESRAV